MNNTFGMLKAVLLHPFDFFYDLQFENRSRVYRALVVMALALVTHFISMISTPFLFQARQPYQISVVVETLYFIVPWLTWSVVNWAVSTILDGEGKFKDILVASTFVLTPMIVMSIPIALVSYIFSLKDSAIYNALYGFMVLWVIFLILVKVKVIHDFEFKKMIGISLLTLLGIFVIWFIFFLIFGLIEQAYQFVLDLINEVSYRI